VKATAPELIALRGVGAEVASTMLVAAGVESTNGRVCGIVGCPRKRGKMTNPEDWARVQDDME
jgi:hypothetical protein